MFPISDDNPTLRTPWMTYIILALMFATWVLVQGAGLNERALAESICNYGLVPAELLHTRDTWMALVWWFAWQVIAGFPLLNPVRPGISGGMAVWAHIGGFVAGALLVKIFEKPALVAKRKLIHDSWQSFA